MIFKNIRKKLIYFLSIFVVLSIPIIIKLFYSFESLQLEKTTVLSVEKFNQLNHIFIGFLLLSLFSFIALMIIIGLRYAKKSNHWWIISMLISIGCFIALNTLWYRIHTKHLLKYGEYNPIYAKQDINDFFNTYPDNGEKYIKIPTGLFIDHMVFTRKDNEIYPGLILNGIVWQKYKKTIPKDIARGIIFPDAATLYIDKIYDHSTENYEIMGWRFTAHIFQRFDLSKYPFDFRHTKIRLTHQDFEKNVILIPDFESIFTPTIFPGIENALYIPHWHLKESFYGLKKENFNTNFGMKEFEYDAFPQLYYYLLSNRNVIGTALTFFILFFSCMIILFITLLAFLKHQQLTTLLGFSTLSILGVCSGLLFVLITSQMELRQAIGVGGTAYMEYLFGVTYLAIIGVAANSIAFAIYDIKTLQYKDNLIIKLLYWPFILLAIIIVTAITFY
ncbi:MAG: hypothetical protein WDZ41_04985 [Candidatus Babeliales bacterium]